MAQPLVPHICTFSYSIPAGEMIVFPMDKHRTRFIMQDIDAQNLLFWCGCDPAIDITEWLALGGSMEPDTFDFSHGLAGPIYVTDSVGGIGELTIISSLQEAPTFEVLPV